MVKFRIQDQNLLIIASLISIFIHVFLLLFKFLVGIFTNSLSIVALAADSAFDLIAAFATYWGIRKISKPADPDHLYGHGKYDFLAGAIQAIILFMTASIIIVEAVLRLVFGAEVSVNLFSFTVIYISIGLNVFLNRYLMYVSKKTRSIAIEANAKNSLTDILNYIIVLSSLFFILFLQLSLIDGFIAIIISAFVIFEGYTVIRKCLAGLLDATPREVNIGKLKQIIESVAEVKSAHSIRMRCSGPFIFMDSRVEMSAVQSVESSHAITEDIEKKVKAEFPEITDVLIHVEPKKILDDDYKDKISKRVLEFEEIKDCHHIHFGFAEGRYILDFNILVDRRCSLDYVHSITEQIESVLKEDLKTNLDTKNLDIVIHAEPYYDKNEERILEEVAKIVDEISVVDDCHNIKIHIEKDEVVINLHALISAEMSVDQAHQIADIIEKIAKAKLRKEFKGKSFNVYVHLEPKDEK